MLAQIILDMQHLGQHNGSMETQEYDGDDLGAARGIMNGFALGAMLWCLIGIAVWVAT